MGVHIPIWQWASSCQQQALCTFVRALSAFRKEKNPSIWGSPFSHLALSPLQLCALHAGHPHFDGVWQGGWYRALYLLKLDRENLSWVKNILFRKKTMGSWTSSCTLRGRFTLKTCLYTMYVGTLWGTLPLICLGETLRSLSVDLVVCERGYVYMCKLVPQSRNHIFFCFLWCDFLWLSLSCPLHHSLVYVLLSPRSILGGGEFWCV